MIFIELPKFKASTFTEKKSRNLWVRFLTEINERTTEVSEELYSESSIKKALEYLQESAFTKGELAYYEKYWDNIRVEKSALDDYYEKGLNVSHDKLMQAEEKIEESKEKVEQAEEKVEEFLNKLYKIAKQMKKFGIPTDVIMEATGLSKEDIENL